MTENATPSGEIDRGRTCNLCLDADRLKGSRYCATCEDGVA